jgi:very-short-patch-repair endonuclease
MTPTEAILWEILRNRKFKGLKFRRQMNIGPYIVDFLCKEYKVALEIDGGIHDEEDQKEHDLSRTIFLNELDYQILRIKNEDIYNNLQFTLEDIYTFIKKQETKQFPLLRKGEG